MKYRAFILAAAAFLAQSCAKDPSSSTPSLEKRAFDAWIEVNKGAGWEQTPLGCWIISSEDGDVAQPLGTKDDSPFVRLEYTITDLKGNISSSTVRDTAIQLGTYAKSYWYGPAVSARSSGVYAGLEEILSGMNVGGRCRFVMPGWLASTASYDSGEEYNANVTGNSSTIYDIHVVDRFDTVSVWEVDRIREAVGGDAALAQFDTLESGIYYKTLVESDNPDTTYSDGAAVYVNYVCRRALDGVAVDSNIADSLKVIGNFVKGTEYEPLLVNWDEDYTDMTMTSSESDMISGFARAVQAMKPHEKGIVYFISDYGYTSSGSGSAIPGYCPLVFEIEMVDKPE